MSEPTADDLALAREIEEATRLMHPPSDVIETIAALIAKHRQPPPAPQRDAWYVPDLTRAWLARERPELVPHAEWLNGQFQLAFNKGKQIGEGNVREQRDREWASSPAMTIEEQMSEIDRKFAETPGVKFGPSEKLNLIRKGKPNLDELQAENERLRELLAEAIDVIKVFHGEEAWDLYEQSPEMKRFRAALAQLEPATNQENAG